eukprot:5156414-Alexandrium_andersonii.AAC.1
MVDAPMGDGARDSSAPRRRTTAVASKAGRARAPPLPSTSAPSARAPARSLARAVARRRAA